MMMKADDFCKLVSIDDYSSTPKYLQLGNSIIAAVDNGKLKIGDMLPSINEASCFFDISRDTAERGYRYLKSQSAIISVPGKGYYVSQSNFKERVSILLLFNKLSAHKKIIYDSFVASLGEDAVIDFYIYNNDYNVFKKLIQNKKTDYSHYVIIPHFVEGGELAYEILNTIPKGKLLLLDKKLLGIDGAYAAIHENFEKDIYEALVTAKESLEKYHTLKIVFPKNSYFPKEIINGFKRFCQQYAFNFDILNDISIEPISTGEAYIILMEDDLVVLIERIVSLDLKIGKHVGVISYNETPLKKIILKGITTISTDFKKMGQMAAEMIINQEIAHKEVPFYLTLRPSL